MKRALFGVAGLVCCCFVLAVVAARPSAAQGVFKPIMALITNDVTDPVPVSVVPSPAAQTVVCWAELHRIFFPGTALVAEGEIITMSNLHCPDGVNRIDVTRVSFTPNLGSNSSFRVMKWAVTFGLTEFPISMDAAVPRFMGVVTDGAPEHVLASPIRIDKSASETVIQNSRTCSSGLAGVEVACEGVALFTGTPVP